MAQSLIRQWEKLPYQEWFRHRIHALLGFYCLGHFAYRFGVFFGNSETNDMGFEILTTAEMMGVFLPHVMLQLSGFKFSIPQKRHPDGNRIWPQYRYEAVVFCGRCLALMAIAWHRKLYGCSSHGSQEGLMLSACSVWPPAVVVVATMLSADFVASHFHYLGVQSRTIRDLRGPPGVLYLMSSAQFHANVHCLLTIDKLCVQLSALTVVQTTAFGMTLRRKAIISQPQGLALYSIVLILGMAVILRDLMDRGVLGRAITMGNVAALLRFELHLNKYALWTLVALLLHLLTVDSGGDFYGARFLGEKERGGPRLFAALDCCSLELLAVSNKLASSVWFLEVLPNES